MERQIGTTDLRQKLTDVLQIIRDEHVTYVVGTFGRSQAALINLDDYRQFQNFQEQRESWFQWLEETTRLNSAREGELSEEELLGLIGHASSQVSNEA